MRKYLSLILAVTIFLPVFFAPIANAEKCNNEGTFLTIPPWYAGVCKKNTNAVEITNIAGDISRIALNIFTIVLYVISYIAVAMVIFGGIKYVISTGDPTKATAARQTIQNALIGLLLGLSALAIVNFVSGRIG
jgi:hypothetical protein